MDQIHEQAKTLTIGMAINERANRGAEMPEYLRIKEDVNWVLKTRQYDGRPYVRVTCSYCRQDIMTTDVNFVLKHPRCDGSRHCSGWDPDPMPEDIRKRLEEMQIKLGLRQARTLVEKILGKPGQPVAKAKPNLSVF